MYEKNITEEGLTSDCGKKPSSNNKTRTYEQGMVHVKEPNADKGYDNYGHPIYPMDND